METRDSFGPVQLDAEADTFVGCIVLSNNTAELSAVPHAMADMISWRVANTEPLGLRLMPATRVGMIMVYDSQYTKDQCTAPRPPGRARWAKNATVIAVCRRLMQATTERGTDVRWVKVKGHSDHEGNDAADTWANWAQNGGTRGESNISNLMAYLRQQG